MFKFTKCDFCPVVDYYLNLYGIPHTCTDKDGISPLDCEFLLENIYHYRLKMIRSGTEKSEKEHAKAQINRIFWIFEQFGIPKQMVNDAIPIQNRRNGTLLYSLVTISRKRRIT